MVFTAGAAGATSLLAAVLAATLGAASFFTAVFLTTVLAGVFLTVSNCFKLFDQNLALTAGAPSKKTAMLALDIYNSFYGRSGFEGVGQAKAVIFFCLVALITLLQLQITRKKEVEQ